MTIESSRQVLNRQTDINLPRAPVRAKKTMNIALLYWYGPKKNTDESQNILNRHDTEICHFLGSNPDSVKSSVIRQVATVAGNKENFSYLTATNKPEDNTNVTEVNDTDIDITKFLKSPDPQAQNINKDNNNSISEDKSKKKYEEEKKVFESSIEFVSDGEESDFDEKLIWSDVWLVLNISTVIYRI